MLIGKFKYLINKNKTNPIIKFDRGPHIATKIVSNLLFLKFDESIKTGLPQPKPVRIIKINPTISICINGFNVNLELYFWLISPLIRAIIEWVNSCIEIEITMNISINILLYKPKFSILSSILKKKQ